MASQVDEAFCFDSIVRGHHIYNRVWTLFLGKILTATVATAIPSPLRRVFALAAVVAVPLTTVCKCSVYLRVATSQVHEELGARYIGSCRHFLMGAGAIDINQWFQRF